MENRKRFFSQEVLQEDISELRAGGDRSPDPFGGSRGAGITKEKQGQILNVSVSVTASITTSLITK